MRIITSCKHTVAPRSFPTLKSGSSEMNMSQQSDNSRNTYGQAHDNARISYYMVATATRQILALCDIKAQAL